MQIIREDLNRKCRRLKQMEAACVALRQEILAEVQQLGPHETISEMTYVKATQILNRETAVLLALKYNLAIPTIPKQETDWKALEEVLLERLPRDDLQECYKEKKGFLKGGA